MFNTRRFVCSGTSLPAPILSPIVRVRVSSVVPVFVIAVRVWLVRPQGFLRNHRRAPQGKPRDRSPRRCPPLLLPCVSSPRVYMRRKRREQEDEATSRITAVCKPLYPPLCVLFKQANKARAFLSFPVQSVLAAPSLPIFLCTDNASVPLPMLLRRSRKK